MQVDPSAILGATGAAVTGIVWLVRLEGRLNTMEARFNDFKTDIEEIKRDLKKLLQK